ncbi:MULTISPECIES: sensor histidine kinase [unclassified Enterococcus]|uniref:sensor histidine kinase n=1 Tax=unclassified Enterococcus TaxID=2608891 RepID=UPI001CE1070E|nr:MULTISPECIES: HAMP domain-containing sensor histidine kinase [unclassified Enterococcus]MCA5011634.1 HAMP domain-containing histidine kinase [Enterococcus sp. S23]MCA5014924.1 HAMP domain-containing histidine kinase [Enterococcus sp. S22(2020)]
MKKKTRKISTTLTLTFSLIIIGSFFVMFIFNTLVVPYYYSAKMEHKVTSVMASIQQSPNDSKQLELLENEQQVTIVAYPLDGASLDDFNEGLSLNLNRKQIALNRFWVTQETLEQLQSTSQPIQRSFDQGKQKSSFLVEMMVIDDTFFLVGISTVNFSETAELINSFNFISLSLTLVLIIFMIYISVRKITDPLVDLKKVAEEITALTFVTTENIPANEIGELAVSINKMSYALATYQKNLLAKNNRLKQFTADLTHELKTPIALIKAYSSGIEDGLDDGTYLNTILQQAQRLNEIVDQMLDYAKLEQQHSLQKVPLQLSKIWKQTLQEQESLMKKKSILLLEAETDRPLSLIEADPLLLKRAFDNLLTNSIKYTTDKEIQVSWRETNEFVELSISNQTSLPSDFDVEKLWEAFYVHEKSRNKNLSGTGLGLSIVQSIMNEHGFDIEARLVNKTLIFNLHFYKQTIVEVKE